MKRRFLGIVGLILVAVWLEQSVLPFWLPPRVSPRLLTLFVAGLGIWAGARIAAGAGFVAGILPALLCGEPLGVSSLALALTGWVAGAAAARFPLTALGAFALAGALALLEGLIGAAAGRLVFGLAFEVSWPSVALALAFAPLALLTIRWIWA